MSKFMDISDLHDLFIKEIVNPCTFHDLDKDDPRMNTSYVDWLEKKLIEAERFRDKVFQAHPNIDIDIDHL